jgi:hypothetical protein
VALLEGSDVEGAHRGIIESAKLSQIEPSFYLTDLIAKLVDGGRTSGTDGFPRSARFPGRRRLKHDYHHSERRDGGSGKDRANGS